MATTYVHGLVRGDQQVEGVVRALHDRGFDPKQIEVQQRPEEREGPRRFGRSHELVRDTLLGAGGGALSAAPLGAIAPGTLAQVELGAWFEQLVSSSVGIATLQALGVGGVIGAVFGALVGLYRLGPAPGPLTRFEVGVRTDSEAADKAMSELRRQGGWDVERHSA